MTKPDKMPWIIYLANEYNYNILKFSVFSHGNYE